MYRRHLVPIVALYCTVQFSYSRSSIQSDDGYICTAETRSCCYTCEKSYVHTAVLHIQTSSQFPKISRRETVPCTYDVAYCASVLHLAVSTSFMVAG